MAFSPAQNDEIELSVTLVNQVPGVPAKEHRGRQMIGYASSLLLQPERCQRRRPLAEKWWSTTRPVLLYIKQLILIIFSMNRNNVSATIQVYLILTWFSTQSTLCTTTCNKPLQKKIWSAQKKTRLHPTGQKTKRSQTLKVFARAFPHTENAQSSHFWQTCVLIATLWCRQSANIFEAAAAPRWATGR